MQIFITFDNDSISPDIQPLWGFAAYIKLPHRDLMFDTGSDGRVLLKNMAKMGLSPANASRVFLSHPHWDHIGGLDSVIELNPTIPITLTSSFSPRLVANLRSLGHEVQVIQEPAAIEEGLWSTGAMGEVGEQGLVVSTPKGAVLVVGCAHPGIVQMVRQAKELVGEVIYAIGGFHLFRSSAEEIWQVAEALKTERLAFVTPTHCSGDLAKEIFAEVFKDGYIPGGAGQMIDLSDLAVV